MYSDTTAAPLKPTPEPSISTIPRHLRTAVAASDVGKLAVEHQAQDARRHVQVAGALDLDERVVEGVELGRGDGVPRRGQEAERRGPAFGLGEVEGPVCGAEKGEQAREEG
ncbi:major facilitator superfamily transporter [Colletotrichum scovillei]|uniref:Major facilitator superfamily transporter n=1 Tax=Colletotrichum scovillei TaxID=1209932 RepID=A0A9P7QVD6_9PEZI|nr:major facilitator superfamily transporter [Colletotrichum scovillei]KAG7046280.1 major facilitator superfamily transporter [Colletotrichum scovillei]KAG7063630.1 major facilitator superfamily transporter [Colletotrichum scovillei]